MFATADNLKIGVTLISLCVSSLRVTVTAFFFVFLWYQQKSAAPARLVGAADYKVY